MSQGSYEKLVQKVDKIVKEKKLDLSSDEDLSIGIMNLISIEEHLFFTAEKTENPAYYKILAEVREMRKELLKKIIKEYEGEVWCISKHLLSSSMRLMEVGTKQLGKGNNKEAEDLFKKSYQLYSLFWALNLKLVDGDTIKSKGIVSDKEIQTEKDTEASIIKTDGKEHNGFFQNIGNAFKKAIDCCKE